jgi:threonine dehydratase
VVAVQSEACPAFVQSLADGTTYLRWEGEESWAEGLEGGTGATGVAAARRFGAKALAVPEDEVRAAVRRIYGRDSVAIEGSSAVVFAARQLGNLDDLPEPCVHVVTGGNVSGDRLAD